MELRNEEEEKLRSALSTEIVRLSFRKIKSNETRDMTCTLADEYIPKSVNTKSIRKEPENLITVYDVNINSWRRFYINRVDKWHVEEREHKVDVEA